jgi:hypothetical protein
MANWQHRLKLKDISEAYDRKEIDSKEAGKKTSERIKQLAEHLIPAYASYKEEFLEIAYQFESVEDQDDYNNCLEQLYDLGDTKLDNEWPGKKLCWIGFSI